jgi:hypothetical protein
MKAGLHSVSLSTVFVMAMTAGALAQGLPPGVSTAQSPTCTRLEGQLTALERGGTDPGLSDQVRRYEETANRQQFELDRTVAHARRIGCEGSGFFLFGIGQPPQCDQLNNQIQRMRANLDRVHADLSQLRGGPQGVEGQRRAILLALGQNNCGPQYRVAAPPPQPQGFLSSLFGGGGSPTTTPSIPDDPNAPVGSNFRTVCVRLCDGFFFPVSNSASPGKFRDDEKACQRMCPAAEVALYSYRNPGEDISQAVSLNGRPYTELPNAYRYRQEFNAACSCRRAGESWADALKNLDDRPEQGDIVVTDEKAKALSQPKAEPAAKQAKQPSGRKSEPPVAPEATAPTPAPAAPATTTAAPAQSPESSVEPPASGKRTVRSVGPPFIPAR